MKEGVILSYSETCPPINPGVPNTKVYIPVAGFGGELRPIINRTVKFASTTSDAIGVEYLKGLKKHGIHGINDFVNAGMHLPGFRIYDSENARYLLEKTDYSEELICHNGLLLVFRLPRLTESAWSKALEAGHTETEMAASVEYKLGKTSSTIFRDSAKDYEQRQRLSFRRINKLGDHDPNDYYYLHEVRPPEGRELKNRQRKTP